MSHERPRHARWHAPVVVLGMLTGAGCATMDVPDPADQVHVEGLYGTWHWLTEKPGAGQDAVRGYLVLNSDETYVLTESRSGQSTSSRGQFKVYQVASQDSLDPWIEFNSATTRRERVFQFSGPDTLLVRDGDLGRTIVGSEIDLYVRARLDRIPDKDQAYDQEPEPLTAPPPIYPEFARDANITGKVVLHVLVREDGRVQKIEVVESVPVLDAAAIDAVSKWTFKPALKNGLPVAAWAEIPIDFHQ